MTVRRITERQVQKGDTAVTAAMIGGQKRVGTLEGVRVDFRHQELPSDYEALPWWFVWGPPPDNAGIIFPSEAAFGIEELRSSKSGVENLEPIYAHPGDKISVDDVRVEVGDARFDDPHDCEVRFARLQIKRPNGEVVHAGPLAFYGNARLLKNGTREAFDHVVERLLRLNGVSDFPREFEEDWYIHGSPFWARPLEKIALEMARDSHGAAFELIDGLPNDESYWHKRVRLREALNGAALAGFLLGKSEAKKPERMASAIMANREKATAKTIRLDWHERARELFAEDPTLSLNRICETIAAEDGNAEVSAVSRSIRRADKRGAGIVPPTSPSYLAR